MKTSNFIIMFLLSIVLYTNFIACSDDEPQIPTTITGTTWEGVDPYGYRMVVNVETSTGGIFSVYEPESNKLSYTLNFTYLFNRETGSVIVEMGNEMLTGQINGNTLTVEYYGMTLIFQKQ